jgi:GAF domain-containing protein
MTASEPGSSELAAAYQLPGPDISADLAASLADLAALVAGSLDLTGLLEQVATFAVRAIPGADGAAVALQSPDTPNRVAALASSAEFVQEIVRLQYEMLGEGPCITATQERATVRSGSLGGEQRWPRFGPRASRLGVHSALSLPLMLPGQVIGAINVYAFEKDAFEDHAEELGELFATPAAVAVHNAQILNQANVLVEQLKTAIATRPVVDQAIGLIRARTGVASEVALSRLRAISQRENVKVVEVARRMVDEAVRRARSRGGDGD